MNIVLTGSLGNISKPLAISLIEKGHSVTIISSNADKQTEIEALGSEAAIGKLEDTAFVSATFSNADAVYCMTPISYKEENPLEYYQKILNSYSKAIKQSKVKKAVFLTGWAMSEQSAQQYQNVFEELPDTSITEIRPGVFYPNFYNYIAIIKEKGIIIGNFGDEDRMIFVSPKDIAFDVAEELTSSYQGKKVRYAASEELTCNEAAQILGEEIGKPDLKWATISNEQMKEVYISLGMPALLADDLVAMQATMHNGRAYEKYLQQRPELGKIKLKKFAKEFAEAYNQL
jgi:NAD(P)H dehydrogenase (quinone)